MQTVLGEGKMEGIGHLLFGLASGANIGHRQRQRHTVGRVEEIIIFLPECLIEIEGKGAISLDQRCQFSFIYLR
jgi:hypothetical protein